MNAVPLRLEKRVLAASAARLAPTAALVALAVVLAWRERGSIAAADWLAYLLIALGIAAAVLLGRMAHVPRPLVALSATALGGLAAWAVVSAAWSPAPALARDEGLLRVLYLVALLVPATTLRSLGDRLAATGALVGAVGLVALAMSLELMRSDALEALYLDGRPYFPLAYPNAQAAFFALALWPAAALAARREGALAGRALALAAGSACAAATLMTQSKGAVVALALSVVVLFAVSPSRLRLLVPTAVMIGLAAAAFLPLTAPIRVEDGDFADAVDRAAAAVLACAGAALLLGLVYALADRRLHLGRRTVVAAGAAVWLLLAGAVAAGAYAFLTQVEQPRDYLADRWQEVTSTPEGEGFSHFTTLGSNRADYWRVAVEEFQQRPVRGLGSRGFAAAYLREGRSLETPARAHSLPLDVLSEEGAIGAALLVLALVPLLGIALVQARRSPFAAALAAAAVYWVAHASLDWNWSLPAVGVPFFVLLGVAVSGSSRPLRTPAAAGLAAAAVVVAAVAGATWLSARLTERALENPQRAADDLRRAERLDPLSPQPFVARFQLSQTPDARIDALERALAREPGSFALHYFLGLTYRDAGQIGDARRELEIAKRLAPRVEAVDTALESLEG